MNGLIMIDHVVLNFERVRLVQHIILLGELSTACGLTAWCSPAIMCTCAQA